MLGDLEGFLRLVGEEEVLEGDPPVLGQKVTEFADCSCFWDLDRDGLQFVGLLAHDHDDHFYHYCRCYLFIMSHLTIQRKRTESLRTKLHSEQSSFMRPRQSLSKILNDSLAKRRRTTINSPDHGPDAGRIQE